MQQAIIRKVHPLPFLLLIGGMYLASCSTTNNAGMEKQIQAELYIIDSLLRNADYSFEMAKTLDAAYYAGVGEKPTDFLQPGEDTATVKKSMKEEKAAISLAGFYATECGVTYLSTQTKQKPTDILTSIVNQTIDSASVTLLHRFANATWKAGQPFRDIKRITRATFTVFNFLPPEEVKKDDDQVRSAASKLLSAMQDVVNGDIKSQMEKMRSLLQSESFAWEIAAYQDSTYNSQQQQPAKNSNTGDDTAMITKSVKEQKIATNIAGFYALECGINYFVATKHILPSAILQSINDNTISKEDKELFCRFANATWKAGQPFRGLSRIARETFTPFYFLSVDDVEKDWVQVKAAAKKLQGSLLEKSL
jgi:hypothetical protein